MTRQDIHLYEYPVLFVAIYWKYITLVEQNASKPLQCQ